MSPIRLAGRFKLATGNVPDAWRAKFQAAAPILAAMATKHEAELLEAARIKAQELIAKKNFGRSHQSIVGRRVELHDEAYVYAFFSKLKSTGVVNAVRVRDAAHCKLTFDECLAVIRPLILAVVDGAT